MARVTEEQMKRAFTSGVMVKDHPKVLFRYGFKIVEFDGEQVIEALSQEEYIQMREKEEGHPIEIVDNTPTCAWNGNYCVAWFGCTRCSTHNDGSGWYCTCDGT
jgi:hypothetical protein